MNPFKILQIRKNIKEARANPSGFVGGQAKEFIWGILTVPIVMVIVVLLLFFTIGYTDVFGFQWGFFKFLFWVGLVVSATAFVVVRKMVQIASKVATSSTKRVVDAVIVEEDKLSS